MPHPRFWCRIRTKQGDMAVFRSDFCHILVFVAAAAEKTRMWQKALLEAGPWGFGAWMLGRLQERGRAETRGLRAAAGMPAELRLGTRRAAADIRRVAETVGAGASRGCGRGREPELGELARAEAGAMDTRRELPVWPRDLGPWAPSAGRDGERGLSGRWRRGFRKNPAVFASFLVGNTSLATMAQLHGNERKCHVPPGI